MSKSYEVNFNVIIKQVSNAVVFVEADSEEEALALAESKMGKGEWVEIDEEYSNVESYELSIIHEEG